MVELPFRTVLAASDLGEGSDRVLRAAAALCALGGARLHVIHAFDLPPSPYLDHYGDTFGFQARVEAAERDLAEQVERVVPPQVEVAGRRVEVYAAHRAIAEHARAAGAGVVVIGPHARGELEVGFLGGTADRLVRTLEAPCLVVRGPLRMPLARVVVPMDLSEWARGALETAIAWAAAFGVHRAEAGERETELSIVHVIPEAVTGQVPFERAEVVPGEGAKVAEAAARAPAGVRLREEVLWGDRPAEEVVAFAARERAELIVMATHGYGAIRRALLGGTAQAVARSAPCPVLLVPPALWRGDAEAP
jgi:nucleotide-binding universal stress UspA family protein